MTNEQKNQVAAMYTEGMSIAEIMTATKLQEHEVRGFVTERNKINKRISNATKKAVINWYQQGNTAKQCAIHYGLAPATVHRLIAIAKEQNQLTAVKHGEKPKAEKPKTEEKKEPATAATVTDPEDKNVDDIHIYKNTTENTDCQALKGIDVIGLMQSMLISISENFGGDTELVSIGANHKSAKVVFKYYDKDYAVTFGSISE